MHYDPSQRRYLLTQHHSLAYKRLKSSKPQPSEPQISFGTAYENTCASLGAPSLTGALKLHYFHLAAVFFEYRKIISECLTFHKI